MSVTPLTWVRLEPMDLEELLEHEDGEVVPQSAGVYAWRLSFVPPPDIVHSGSQLEEWVNRVCTRRTSVISETRISSSAFAAVRVGGIQLTENKQGFLRKLCKDPRGRSFLLQYLSNLGHMAPVLYVGQTDGLSGRARKHLQYKTDFANILRRDYRLSFDDLVYEYCEVPLGSQKNSDSMLTLLEMLAQRSLCPPGVTRSG